MAAQITSYAGLKAGVLASVSAPVGLSGSEDVLFMGCFVPAGQGHVRCAIISYIRHKTN